MPDGLYEHDALAWAEKQAALLRRLAAGEGVNEAVDWAHVIEEVQDVGLSELRACRSLLQQAMVHLLKLHAWPGSRTRAHWEDEARAFLDDAALSYSSSMRQRIDLDGLYSRSLRRVLAASDESGAARALPDQCPFTLDRLLADEVTILVSFVEST